jgi:hypothetical protein
MGLERMLRVYFLQQWYALADEALEDPLYDSQALQRLAGIELAAEGVPDATTLLKFRRLLETHDLCKALFPAINADLAARGLLPRTVVAMGSTVEVEDRESSEVDTYTLVYPEHADGAAGRLSMLAPLGMGLIGFTEGDKFAWRTPGGPRELLIRKVEAPAAA